MRKIPYSICHWHLRGAQYFQKAQYFSINNFFPFTLEDTGGLGQGSFLIPILKGQKHPSQLVVPWAWSHSSGQLEKFLLSSVRSSNAPSFFPWGPIFQLLPTHHLLSPGCQWVKGRLHFWQSLSNHSQYGKIIVIIKKFKKEKKPNRTPPNLEIPG